MRKTIVIVIALLVTGGAWVVVRLGYKAPWKKPEIAVRFVGMTNDAAGAGVARFELRNVGSALTDVSIPGFIDVGMRGGGYFGFTNAALQPGASAETSIEVPTTRDRWRAEFLCSIPLNCIQKARNFGAAHGLPIIPVAQTAISVYSEYLPPNPQGGAPVAHLER